MRYGNKKSRVIEPKKKVPKHVENNEYSHFLKAHLKRKKDFKVVVQCRFLINARKVINYVFMDFNMHEAWSILKLTNGEK